MSKEKFTLQIIEGIYDIQPPVAPPLSSLESTLIILMSLASIIYLSYFFWRISYSKKAIAKREIKELQKNFNEQKMHGDIAYQLSNLIKKGLSLKNINKKSALPAKLAHKEQLWQAYVTNISTLRYTKTSEQNAEINKLFNDSLFWLKVWP